MHNYAIADNFSLLSKLMDIHGDDSFKAKTYAITAFTIEKLPAQLSEMQPEKIYSIKGVGQAIGKKILEQLQTGRLPVLDEYLLKTPAGVLELLKVKGLGPKKIATVWKELGIESMGELLYACDENRLTLYKGFGAKTQQNIQESINFILASKGSYLYSQIEGFANQFTTQLNALFAGYRFVITGDFARQMEVIHKLEWVTNTAVYKLQAYFDEAGYDTRLDGDNILWAKGQENVSLEFHCVGADHIVATAFERSGSTDFIHAFNDKYDWKNGGPYENEAGIFRANGLAFIPPYRRETAEIIDVSAAVKSLSTINVSDIRGIIHSHSNWSDGGNTLEEMAKAAMAKGLEYLVISDHSQSAFYANGLYPDRIKAQHQLIDELNEKLVPFKIFKSIESDILNDGSLDYPDDILASFDLVIASVHSNFKMSQEKATARLLKAISNPYTTILGHMTGRLLLSRNGYPVDHAKVIDACATHQVVIELNAHPRRLDIDWRHIPAALSQGVFISIDPDAHTADAFDDVRFGVLVAQKAGLTPAQNLSSFTLVQFEDFLKRQHKKRG